MTETTPKDIVLRLDTIDQLFNAPDVDPFSENEIDVLGEPALTRVTRRLLANRTRHWSHARMVIQLPADQITPDLQVRTAAALRRYTQAKIEEDELMIRLSRVRGLIGLALVTVIVLAALALAYILLTTVFANVDSVVQGLIAASVSVFAWVILWDPLERLLFDWVNPRLEIAVLRRIGQMPVVIEPQV